MLSGVGVASVVKAERLHQFDAGLLLHLLQEGPQARHPDGRAHPHRGHVQRAHGDQPPTARPRTQDDGADLRYELKTGLVELRGVHYQR